RGRRSGSEGWGGRGGWRVVRQPEWGRLLSWGERFPDGRFGGWSDGGPGTLRGARGQWCRWGRLVRAAGQVRSGSARRRNRAVRKPSAHGQPDGRCKWRRRAVRGAGRASRVSGAGRGVQVAPPCGVVTGPGRVMKRRRIVLATTKPWAPSPSAATQRSRLCARVATSAQAAVAPNTPEGQWHSPAP